MFQMFGHQFALGLLLTNEAPAGLQSAAETSMLRPQKRTQFGEYETYDYVLPINPHYPRSRQELANTFAHDGILFWAPNTEANQYWAFRIGRGVLFGYISTNDYTRATYSELVDPEVDVDAFLKEVVETLKRTSGVQGIHMVRAS